MNRFTLPALAAALLLGCRTEQAPVPPPAPVGARVEVNGMQVYYEVSGAGDPLVVLHGAYMNINDMGEIIPQLAQTHKVYALEFQGHGRTTDIDRPITYPNLADDVAAFMDKVGLAKADVFGYSMGGQVGLQLAIRHPAKVNKLVAASVAYDLRGWQPVYTEAIPQMTVEMLTAMPFAKEYPKLAANPNGFPELARKLIALEKEPMAWEADVKAIKAPVLVIAGDADVMTLEHSVALCIWEFRDLVCCIAHRKFFCRTSKMSHAHPNYLGAASVRRLSEKRRRCERWLWRLVRWIERIQK